MPPAKAAVAEFVGAFALMFVGGGAIIVTQGMESSLIAVAVAHGLILAIMVSATMHISGGQLNPAVSIGLSAIGKQPWSQAGIFIIAQVLGAVVAAALLKFFLGGAYNVGNVGATLGTLTNGSDLMKEWPLGAAGLELIATFFLMFAVMGTAVDKAGVGKTAAIGGFGIGLTVAADILAIGPATGASMNPSRSFGPALIAGAWDHHWVYWLGPIAGACLAAVIYKAVFQPDHAK